MIRGFQGSREVVRVKLLRRGTPLGSHLEVPLRLLTDDTGSYVHWNGHSCKVDRECGPLPTISIEYGAIKKSLHRYTYEHSGPNSEVCANDPAF